MAHPGVQHKAFILSLCPGRILTLHRRGAKSVHKCQKSKNTFQKHRKGAASETEVNFPTRNECMHVKILHIHISLKRCLFPPLRFFLWNIKQQLLKIH